MIELSDAFELLGIMGLFTGLQMELTRRNLTGKINNAVSRDAEERKKIYKKLCKLEKEVKRVIK